MGYAADPLDGFVEHCKEILPKESVWVVHAGGLDGHELTALSGLNGSFQKTGGPNANPK